MTQAPTSSEPEAAPTQPAPAPAWWAPSVAQAVWGSRIVAWLVGVLGVIQLGLMPGAPAANDPAGLTAPFHSYLANAVVGPLARWDSVWYLTIAHSGYGGNLNRTAFFPLYPALIHVFGAVVRSDLVAGVLISLVCFGIGLELLRRLVRLDFSARVAAATVVLVAFSPMSFFFSAVYTESLFLALSVGAIYAARRERWWLAGVLGLFAALSRNSGVILIVPLAVIYLYGPRADATAPRTRWARMRRARGPREVGARSSGWVATLRADPGALLPTYRVRPDLAWLALVPAGLGIYLGFLALKYGHGLAPFQVEAAWYRHTTFPASTVIQGVDQAINGLRQLLHGPTPPYYVPAYAAGVTGSAALDVCLCVFLLGGLVALIAMIRRLIPAYTLYTLVALIPALSAPVSLQPLASLPRYELVIFPMFIWAAELLTRRRLLLPALALSAVLLGLFTVEFATWRWVA